MLKYLVGIKGFNFNYSCHSHVNLAKLDMLHSIYGNIGSTLIINSLLLKYKISSKTLMLKENFFNKMYCDGVNKNKFQPSWGHSTFQSASNVFKYHESVKM